VTAVALDPVWVTAEMAAVHLQWQGLLISPTTIRVWAHRGHIRADGPRGSRYDLVSVQEWADQRKDPELELLREK
jgi:hypothetical protein